MCNGALSENVTSLLKTRGLTDRAVRLRPGASGGNNRVYFVEGAAIPIVAKRYFQSASDKRDRLHSEWSFINYAHATGMRCIPGPIAADPGDWLALYEQIAGRKLRAPEVGEGEVLAAAKFFRALNEPERRREAHPLPRASEAAFSIAEHFAVVEHRLNRLLERKTKDAGEVDAHDLICELSDYWETQKISVVNKAAALRLSLDDVLPDDLRCVSPSDFGFHNVLKRDDGNIYFLDFEYAGWDDPAKMVADFFLQPEVPVDRRFYEMFVQETISGPQAEWQKRRIDVLYPIFAVKWCCIMLNPFVAERAQPGNFANPARDESERKKTQLKKASTALHAMKLGEG